MGNLFSVIAKSVGFLLLGTLALVLTLMGIMIAVAELDLPDDVRSGEFHEFEGAAFGTLDSSLIELDQDNSESDRDGRRVIVLNRGWGYFYDPPVDYGPSELHVIPVSEYFVSDFASIPFPFSRIINPFGKHAEAAVLHDWLYAVGYPGRRKEADVIFYQAMRRYGVSRFRAGLMYAATRIGGKNAWGRANEWRFYSPLIETTLPNECKIVKPSYLSIEKPSARPNQESTPVDLVDTRVSQFLSEGGSYFSDQWLNKFQEEPCADFLYDAMVDRIEEYYRILSEEMSDGGIGIAVIPPSQSVHLSLASYLNGSLTTECTIAKAATERSPQIDMETEVTDGTLDATGLEDLICRRPFIKLPVEHED